MRFKAEILSTLLGLLALIGTVAGSIEAAAADQMPKFDVEPSCRAAARQATTADYASACMQEEQEARTKIEASWPQFNAADKAHCVQLSRMGGQPTFTELLTCLELARDVRTLHNESPPATTTVRAPNQRLRGSSVPAAGH